MGQCLVFHFDIKTSLVSTKIRNQTFYTSQGYDAAMQYESFIGPEISEILFNSKNFKLINHTGIVEVALQ
jgi:hypothetical protein